MRLLTRSAALVTQLKRRERVSISSATPESGVRAVEQARNLTFGRETPFRTEYLWRRRADADMLANKASHRLYKDDISASVMMDTPSEGCTKASRTYIANLLLLWVKIELCYY